MKNALAIWKTTIQIVLTLRRQTKPDEIHSLTEGKLYSKYSAGDEFVFALLVRLMLSDGLDIAVAKPTSRVVNFVQPNRILQSFQNKQAARRAGYDPNMQVSEPNKAARCSGNGRLPIQYRLSGSTHSFRKTAAVQK